MNISLMKAVDAVVGRAAAMILPAASNNIIVDSISSLLIIRPGGIGDAVLLIPALKKLRSRYPAARITVLAEKRNSSVFGLWPDVDQLLHYDCPSELLQALRSGYDLVIDTEQWHHLSAVVARMTRAPMLIGYATNQRSRLFNYPVQYCHDDYEIQSFFNLLEPLGLRPDGVPERFLEIPAAAAAVADQLLAELGLKPFVTLFPGASISERRWGGERFGGLSRLVNAMGYRVVVVGGKEDQEQGETIIAGGVGINLAGRTSLPETASIIDRSALLVSGDSGVLHIAVGLGKPTVSLFGPGRAKKWAPVGKHHMVINKHLPCSPCTTYGNTPHCKIGAQCMRDITVEDVETAVRALLSRNNASL